MLSHAIVVLIIYLYVEESKESVIVHRRREDDGIRGRKRGKQVQDIRRETKAMASSKSEESESDSDSDEPDGKGRGSNTIVRKETYTGGRHQGRRRGEIPAAKTTTALLFLQNSASSAAYRVC